MPWTVEYFDDGAEFTYSGKVTGTEVFQAKAEFFAHEFAGKPRWVVCDFSQAKEFDIAKGDIDRIIRQDVREAAKNPDLAECVIATRPYEYGLARMWEMQVDAQEKRTNVCRNRIECDLWLKQHGLGLKA